MMIQKEVTRKTKQRQKEKTQHSTSGKLFNGTHRGAEALVEIPFFAFYSIFYYSF
jgi:hypothetical protein